MFENGTLTRKFVPYEEKRKWSVEIAQWGEPLLRMKGAGSSEMLLSTYQKKSSHNPECLIPRIMILPYLGLFSDRCIYVTHSFGNNQWLIPSTFTVWSFQPRCGRCLFLQLRLKRWEINLINLAGRQFWEAGLFLRTSYFCDVKQLRPAILI